MNQVTTVMILQHIIIFYSTTWIVLDIISLVQHGKCLTDNTLDDTVHYIWEHYNIYNAQLSWVNSKVRWTHTGMVNVFSMHTWAKWRTCYLSAITPLLKPSLCIIYMYENSTIESLKQQQWEFWNLESKTHNFIECLMF